MATAPRLQPEDFAWMVVGDKFLDHGKSGVCIRAVYDHTSHALVRAEVTAAGCPGACESDVPPEEWPRMAALYGLPCYMVDPGRMYGWVSAADTDTLDAPEEQADPVAPADPPEPISDPTPDVAEEVAPVSPTPAQPNAPVRRGRPPKVKSNG